MNETPMEPDDLERRLRAALNAKAEQITDADLDQGREAEVAQLVRAPSRPRRRIYTGAGIAAAAAAILGVGALAIQPGGGNAPVNAASHRSTISLSRPSTTTVGGAGRAQPQATPRATHQDETASLGGLPTATPSSTVIVSGSRSGQAPSLSSSKVDLGTPTPPVMPPGLPQSGPLGSGKYAGPVPIGSASGGPTRMLNMPDAVKWQVLSSTGTSLTVRITDLPTDIEAYWSKTLPGLGWAAAGAGWQVPGTPYAVSAISDKAAFTVSW